MTAQEVDPYRLERFTSAQAPVYVHRTSARDEKC